MLEDCTMDKKSAGRAAQVPTKTGTDCSKKTQDASSSSKCFPRAPRRREGSGPSVQKYDQNRKASSQKGKIFDKRPQQKGQYYPSRKIDTKVEDERAELASVLGHGSKKLSLNHLLNFHYAPKEKVLHNVPGQGRWFGSKIKYNKERFIQANCQFVVKVSGDYSIYLNDPDALVDWDLVEQVRIQSSELLSCPICLSAPTAARMTRCGHIYCWPCILHYLALADKTWRKCPICYESVHKDDLKSAVSLPHGEYSLGDVVTLRLMRREKGSLVVIPVDELDSTNVKSFEPVALQDTFKTSIYCKLLVATKTQVSDILERECNELKYRLKDEEGSPEMCFTEQALELLKQRQESLISISKTKLEEEKVQEINTVIEKEETIETNQPDIIYESAFDNVIQDKCADDLSPDKSSDEACALEVQERPRYVSNSSEGHASVESTEIENIAAEDIDVPEISNTSNKYFYFYQAADGQHMYLHAINARMLETTYGSLEASPHFIKARIIEKEAGSMTSELRNRIRYLQHLPVTCQFEVAELDLRPPLVSKETINRFQEQVDQRKRKRQRRARDERRREKKINEEENKRWGRFPSPNIKIESRYQFPECGNNNSPPNIAYPEPLGSVDTVADTLEELNIDTNSYSGPSFAQMLRTQSGNSLQLSSVRRQPAPQLTTLQNVEPDPDGYVPAPNFSQSFGDAFAKALEKAEKNKSEIDEQGSSSNKKKKKNKQKVLFSTNMACSSK